MAQTRAGSTIVVTGTEVIAGPVQIDAIQNSATTSAAITKGSATLWAGGAGAGAVQPFPLRSASGFTVTVVGGGQVVLYLAVRTNR